MSLTDILLWVILAVDVVVVALLFSVIRKRARRVKENRNRTGGSGVLRISDGTVRPVGTEMNLGGITWVVRGHEGDTNLLLRANQEASTD